LLIDNTPFLCSLSFALNSAGDSFRNLSTALSRAALCFSFVIDFFLIERIFDIRDMFDYIYLCDRRK
jgi:hypothetical protein